MGEALTEALLWTEGWFHLHSGTLYICLQHLFICWWLNLNGLRLLEPRILTDNIFPPEIIMFPSHLCFDSRFHQIKKNKRRWIILNHALQLKSPVISNYTVCTVYVCSQLVLLPTKRDRDTACGEKIVIYKGNHCGATGVVVFLCGQNKWDTQLAPVL